MINCNPKVSILVPICNVEKYLDECLSSIVNQTLKDIEIICLNDGSTDNSLEIVNNYASKDSRIVVVDKPNSGYGDTMNVGIQKAHGDYIGIVESDDFVEPNMFAELYNLAVKHAADIVKSNFYYYYSDLTDKSSQWNNKYGGIWNDDLKQLITTKNTLGEVIPKWDNGAVVCPRENHEWIFYQKPCIWTALYKTSFIKENSIEFLPTAGASFQDTGFSFKSLALADKVVLTHKAYLHYRQDNEKSSMNNPGKVMCTADEHHSIANFLSERGLDTPRMKKIANTVKFGGYNWNLHRLTPELASDFIPIMSKEFKEARKNKEIDWGKINETDTRILNEVIDNPKMYLRRLSARAAAKVSIIVPVYNVKNYIDKCIKSLINQTLKDIEIICVDDGCQDISIEHIEKYWNADPRINIIHQSNGGLSSARNYGLLYSHAQYVMFCDSDDFYSKDMCKKMYNAINDNGVDMAACGTNIHYYSNFDMKRSDAIYYAIDFTSGKYVINKEIIEHTDVSSWNKIYHLSKINQYKLRFPDGLLYEDYYFVKSYMLLSNTIYFVNEKLHNYIRRPGSIMSNTFTGNNPKANDHMRVCIKIFNDYELDYQLAKNNPDYFLNEFVNTFYFCERYGSPVQHEELHAIVNNFIKDNKTYLNTCSPLIVPKIKSLLPNLNSLQKVKRILKSIYKKYSLNYKNKVTLENNINNLRRETNRALSIINANLSDKS